MCKVIINGMGKSYIDNLLVTGWTWDCRSDNPECSQWRTVSGRNYLLVSEWYQSTTKRNNTWWRHLMETFSALLALCAGNSPVTGEFPAQRPVTRSFDVFFDLGLNRQLSKQWRLWWFETLPHSLWSHCDNVKQAYVYFLICMIMLIPCIEGILPKGPYPPCLRMVARAFLAGYPRH